MARQSDNDKNDAENGAGVDDFVYRTLPNKSDHITGFTTDTDLIDLRTILKIAGYAVTNPIADSNLILTENSSGSTDIFYDASGNPVSVNVPITTVDYVTPSVLYLQTYIWFV